MLSVTCFQLIFVVKVEASDPSSEATPGQLAASDGNLSGDSRNNSVPVFGATVLSRVSFHTLTHLLSRNYAFNLTLSSSLFVEWWFRCDQVRIPAFIAPRVPTGRLVR